jgi:lipopolysaccharide/colanic/teichoic acid biosynthesis glycosyltransferase
LHKKNFFLDIKIILKTFKIVFGKTGIRHWLKFFQYIKK